MINYIWGVFIILGIIVSIIKGDSNLTNNLITSGSKGIDMIIGLVPLMCLWLGIMKIAEASGLLKIISSKLSKIVRVIFPEIPDDDPAICYISSNIVMNMLGLGNAATPFGLKTMERLKQLSNSSEASRSMITFLVINTSSVTIVPTTVISLRVMAGSTNPMEIMASCIIATFISTFIGLILDRLFYLIWRRRHA